MEALRSRIARELHDDLGQRITLLSMLVDQLRNDIPLGNEPVRIGLDEIAKGINALAVATTSLSHDLHPGKLQLLGLDRTLEGLCGEVATQHHLQVDFQRRANRDELPSDVELCLLRVTQEALSNVVKHSGSPRATVLLESSGSVVRLVVTDLGRGLELGLDDFKGGLGLLTMRERVELLGGQFVIHSGSTGTQVEATVPLKPRVNRVT